MARLAKSYSSDEILKVLDKAWLTTKDIQIISSCGVSKARKIKQQIAEIVSSEGRFLPDGLVPTDRTIKYLNLNIPYLKKTCKKNA